MILYQSEVALMWRMKLTIMDKGKLYQLEISMTIPIITFKNEI